MENAKTIRLTREFRGTLPLGQKLSDAGYRASVEVLDRSRKLSEELKDELHDVYSHLTPMVRAGLGEDAYWSLIAPLEQRFTTLADDMSRYRARSWWWRRTKAR
jgi:hypothetical protein